MYKCKPERNVKQVILLLTVSALVTIGTFALGVLWSEKQGIINFIGMMLAALCIYVIIRFTMTEMEYTLDNGSFIIVKIVGNKRTQMGVLDLADSVALVSKEDYRKQELNKTVTTVCNYSQNIGGTHWVYVFEFNGKRAMVEFEPNDAFVAIFQTEIENAKKDPPAPPTDDGSHGGILI